MHLLAIEPPRYKKDCRIKGPQMKKGNAHGRMNESMKEQTYKRHKRDCTPSQDKDKDKAYHKQQRSITSPTNSFEQPFFKFKAHQSCAC